MRGSKSSIWRNARAQSACRDAVNDLLARNPMDTLLGSGLSRSDINLGNKIMFKETEHESWSDLPRKEIPSQAHAQHAARPHLLHAQCKMPSGAFNWWLGVTT